MFSKLTGEQGEITLNLIVLIFSVLGFFGSLLFRDTRNVVIFMFNIIIWTSLLMMSIKKYRREHKKK
ncbi:MAG: hypothetical protein MJ245_05825 [Clostridia bacterium]|nr:hypothetical protein [Clostridia bacterium]